MPIILWLRRDLRLTDQAALAAAVGSGAPVIPVFILDDDTPKHRKMGGASRWWLHHSLKSLDADLRKLGSRLILRRGNSVEILCELARETGASSVHCIRHYEPWWRNAEKSLAANVDLIRHDGNYLMPMGSVKTGSGGDFKIYTPFWRALAQHMPPPAPLPNPFVSSPSAGLQPLRINLANSQVETYSSSAQRIGLSTSLEANGKGIIQAPAAWPESDTLESLDLLPTKPDWAEGMRDMWTPGEAGAHVRLADFADEARHYDERRNFPSVAGTSFLSPHLHFGEISPAQAWHAHMGAGGSVEVFLKEIVWREYGQNVICQYPDYGSKNAREAMDALPWRDLNDPEVAADLKAWQTGRTGYPIVDAGMRELWATGWMHNRVRMIAASFLIKHLLIDWRHGERWFWDTLVDADYASNATNWQWTAGTGVDSNMFSRIMAPLSQSEKFGAGDYIRKWVPELRGVSDPYIHDPDEYGARPNAYPAKCIGHRAARERALEALRHTRSAG
jgi:deoxyribodipyrimidine photo-lyase